MANKICLGFVGANVDSTWSSQSHFPALLASPDVELTAVCTTSPESAEEARLAFGAKLAFHDFRTMVASTEIDAVAVVVRVPSHYEPTKLDFPHFKRRKPGNRQVGGTERPGVPECRGRWPTLKNPPTPATGGVAPGRWRPRRSATACHTKRPCVGS